LELLRDVEPAARRVVVCGDLSAADNAVELHRRVGHAVVQQCGADLLVGCGRFGQHVVAGAHEAGMHPERTVWFRQADQAGAGVQALTRPGDVVLIKGSRDPAMAMVADSLLHALAPASAAA